MSQRGGGSGPSDDPEGEAVAGARPVGSHPTPPTVSRPIAPYDPYRSASSELLRPSRRNVAADEFDRPVSRGTGSSPFLPDDDPLNAEAWQLEFDEVAPSTAYETTLPEFDREAPPRRPRRQPSSARTRREPRDAPGRARRTAAAGASARAPRPAVALGVPQVVAGSSLVTDQAMLALLGINAASILLMALLLGMRVGGLPSPMVLQLDAAGSPNLWGPPSALWRLPLMSFFLTVMFLVVAWFLHPIDRFAARFALAAALVAQLIAWVALIQHLG